MIYGKGINDMPRGWYSAEYNKKVYHLWCRMIQRAYDEKWHEKYPTYKDCYVCDRWLLLSNFVEDIKLIDNYELWLSGFGEKRNPYQLDKDIKSGGTNKCYCLENCMFVSNAENARQAVKTRDNTKISEAMKGKFTGEKNPMYGVHRYGEKNPMYGKNHSEETRTKQSESMREVWKNKSDEELTERSRKISESHKGKKNGMYDVHRYGEKSPNHRKILSVDPSTRQIIFTWQYQKQATDFYCIGIATLNYYLKGKSKKGHLYNGFLWYYADDWQQLNK